MEDKTGVPYKMRGRNCKHWGMLQPKSSILDFLETEPTSISLSIWGSCA